MAQKMWLGNDIHAQWVPAPATGMRRNREHYVEELSFMNGGKWVQRSKASASRFSIDLPVEDASQYDSIDAYKRFADGDYGDSFIRFDDKMVINKASTNWAAPGLAEQGWKPIHDTTPSFSATDATGVSDYRYPHRSAVYDITLTADAVPTGQNSVFTVLIPEDSSFYFRWVGSVTGTAVMRLQPILLDGSLGADSDIAPVSQTTAPAFGLALYSGATYRAVKIYLTRTSSATSTATVTAVYIGMSYNGVAPTLGGYHVPGGGHCGLAFSGGADPEEYVIAGRHLVGGAFELVEVESWQ